MGSRCSGKGSGRGNLFVLMRRKANGRVFGGYMDIALRQSGG